MNPLVIVIPAIIALVVLIKWRMKVAENNLIGKPIPSGSGVQHPGGVLLYYFYHPRCGACRTMSLVIDDLMAGNPGKIEKINVAENREMTLSLGIRATPTTLLVKDNKINKAIIGARSYKILESLLKPSSNQVPNPIRRL